MASSFQQHSLSGLPTAVADAFSAAVFLPVAKMMDTWGRAEGFLLMSICATIGLVLMASCDSFAIYCAANVRYKLCVINYKLTRLLGVLLLWIQWHGICR